MTQEQYIAILFDDCGFSSAVDRKNFIYRRFQRNYPDELTTKEKSQLIDSLKEIKADK